MRKKENRRARRIKDQVLVLPGLIVLAINYYLNFRIKASWLLVSSEGGWAETRVFVDLGLVFLAFVCYAFLFAGVFLLSNRVLTRGMNVVLDLQRAGRSLFAGLALLWSQYLWALANGQGWLFYLALVFLVLALLGFGLIFPPRGWGLLKVLWARGIKRRTHKKKNKGKVELKHMTAKARLLHHKKNKNKEKK